MGGGSLGLSSRSDLEDDAFGEDQDDDQIQDWSLLSNLKSSGTKASESLLSCHGANALGSEYQTKLDIARSLRSHALESERGVVVNMPEIGQSTIYIDLSDLGHLFMLNPKGKFLETMGEMVKGNVCLFGYEEVIYLVERGSCLAKLFHPDQEKNEVYKTLPPLSLQVVYALLVTNDKMMDRCMVYSLLKRDGYVVSRHAEFTGTVSCQRRNVTTSADVIGRNYQTGWWFNFVSALNLPWQLAGGYEEIFKYLHSKVLGQSTKAHLAAPEQELSISFNVWKPTGQFKKRSTPLPDVQIAIMKATDKIPSYPQMVSLLERSQTKAAPVQDWNYEPGINMNALRKSDINITIAVVDNATVNFITFNNCSFSAQGPVWRDAWLDPSNRRPRKYKRRQQT